jgi:putative ABC transport system permease protein
MLKTTIKGLMAHKVRLLATALAVTLGISFLAGTLVFKDTITRMFNNLVGNVYSGTDAVVRAKAVFNGPQNTGAQRGRVDESLLPAVQRVPGVGIAEGQIFGYTRLVGKDGKALGKPNMGAPTLGGNWSDTKLNSFHLVAGRGPVADDEIVIDKKSSIDGDLRIGDTTTVLVNGPPQRVRVVGITKFDNADSPAGASVVQFTTRAAQRLVAEPGKYDSIGVIAAKGVSEHQLTQRVAAVLPAGTEAVTGAQITKETQNSFQKSFAFFTTFLLVFAVVALLVAAFMIFNTFSITVAQRTRENGLLRALGASRRQVLSSVLLEAVVVGLVASVVGLAAGVAVAAGLKALLSLIGMDFPASGVAFQSSTIVISLVAGVVITVVAALSPARKAAKVPPVAAMQEVTVTSTGYGSKQRVMVGLLVLAAGLAALFIGLFGHVKNAFGIVGLGALLVFFAVSILGRTVSLPLSRTIGWALPRIRGIPGALARDNATRNPKRTAASASALMIGVGVVAFITIFASSTKASINATIDRAFTGDYIVDSGGGAMGGVDPGMAATLNRLPQVDAAFGLKVGVAKIQGSVKQLVGVDPATAFRLFDVKPLQGSQRDLGRDAIAVYKDVAKSKHLRIGDTVDVVFKETGPQHLRVALIYGENRPAGDYFLGVDAYDANFGNHYDFQVFAKKAPGVTAAAGLAAVKRVAGAYPGTSVMDQTGYKREQAKPINQMLSLVYALLALAVIIALLGIGNTLVLSIFERTRELGLLRAVGMTRAQLRSAIRWESVIIALQGTALGLGIGVFFGWALVRALSSKGIDQFQIPIGSLAAVVVIAALAGVIAAVPPSRRAARLNVLRAIVSE